MATKPSAQVAHPAPAAPIAITPQKPSASQTEPAPDIFAKKPAAATAPSAPPSAKASPPAEPVNKPSYDEKIDAIDHVMLKSLADALGSGQLANLLIGFMTKSEDLIDKIEDAIRLGDIKELGSRAHDLKGMAGNFGMKELSRVAGEAEKAAKTSQRDMALQKASMLHKICTETKLAINDWINNGKA
jgi:HPt (histidine-containing phosphotransfer) domain-containing protein